MRMGKAVPWKNNRSLHAVAWIGVVPSIAECSRCAADFVVPASELRSVDASTDWLCSEFDQHKCKQKNYGQGKVLITPRNGAAATAKRSHRQAAVSLNNTRLVPPPLLTFK